MGGFCLCLALSPGSSPARASSGLNQADSDFHFPFSPVVSFSPLPGVDGRHVIKSVFFFFVFCFFFFLIPV